MATIRTAKKLLLGREIAHMLEKSGVSQTEAAKLIETSQSRIASLLSGGGNIAPGDLILLANKLGFEDEGYQETLRELRRDSHKRGFWSTGYNRAYAEDLRLLVDLEKHVETMRSLEMEVVPGLLQTEAYARALHADIPDTDDATLDDRVQARLGRQDILEKAEPPNLHFVMSESSLRRMWAPTDVMHEQIEHLIILSKRPTVFIQVLPFDLPPERRTSFRNRFTLLRAPSPGVAGPLEVSYVENPGEIRYLDDKKALAAYEAAWRHVADAALRFDESRAFMEKVMHEFTA